MGKNKTFKVGSSLSGPPLEIAVLFNLFLGSWPFSNNFSVPLQALYFLSEPWDYKDIQSCFYQSLELMFESQSSSKVQVLAFVFIDGLKISMPNLEFML